MGFPDGSDGKESACKAGDLGSVPRLGRPPGEGNVTPLQDSCLENSVDRRVWRATGMKMEVASENCYTIHPSQKESLEGGLHKGRGFHVCLFFYL